MGNPYIREDAQYVHLGNSQVEITFQKSDGKLYGLLHKDTQTDLIPVKTAWWSPYDFSYYTNGQYHYGGGWCADSFTYHSHTNTDSAALYMLWNGFLVDGSALDMQVAVSAEVRGDSTLTYWSISITNNAGIMLDAVDFPAINGLGQISTDPNMDSLAYPSLCGLLFQNPLGNFIEGRGWGWEMYYPSSYATMQFMAYYGSNPTAGVFVASHDPNGHSKFFDFSRPASSWLHMNIRHVPEFEAGADYTMTYPVVVGVFSGDWYDAAQIYRSWALKQPWTSKGTLSTRTDMPAWLRSAGAHQWVYTHPNGLPDNPFSIVPDVISNTAHYLGHPAIADWIGWEREGWYIEYPDVFPPKEGWNPFRQAISNTQEASNHILFVPDTTSYSSLAPSWTNAQPSACRDRFGSYLDPTPYSENGSNALFYKVCPETGYWSNKLSAMLTTLAQEKADVIQLDGFPVFGPQPCADSNHGHPLGGGKWWYDSYMTIFSSFKNQARLLNTNLVLSSEGMAEVYIPLCESFWNPSTTGWSPNSHTDMLTDTSRVQLIPLWHAVYHDRALVQSGISFCSRNAPSGAVGYGDYRGYYVRGFALALTWGEMPTTWYCDELMSELDEQEERDVANYLRRIVQARLGCAAKYLVYGRMLRPPAITSPSYHIAGAENIPYSGADYPPFDTPSVLSSTWKAPSGSTGFVLSNISHDTVTVSVPVYASALMLPPNDCYTVFQYKNGVQSIVRTNALLPTSLDVQLQPLDVVVLDIPSGPPNITGCSCESGRPSIVWRDIGLQYMVQQKTNLWDSAWSPASSTSCPIETNTWTDTNVLETSRFYRITVQ